MQFANRANGGASCKLWFSAKLLWDLTNSVPLKAPLARCLCLFQSSCYRGLFGLSESLCCVPLLRIALFWLVESADLCFFQVLVCCFRKFAAFTSISLPKSRIACAFIRPCLPYSCPPRLVLFEATARKPQTVVINKLLITIYYLQTAIYKICLILDSINCPLSIIHCPLSIGTAGCKLQAVANNNLILTNC